MLVAVDEAVVGVVVGVVGVVVVVVVVVVGVMVVVVGVAVVVLVVVVVVAVVEVVVSGANKTRCYTDLSAHSRVWVDHHDGIDFYCHNFPCKFWSIKIQQS